MDLIMRRNLFLLTFTIAHSSEKVITYNYEENRASQSSCSWLFDNASK